MQKTIEWVKNKIISYALTRFSFGVRTKLIAVVSMAILPVVMGILYESIVSSEKIHARFENDLVEQVKTTASHYELMVRSAEKSLSLIGINPIFSSESRTQCHGLVRKGLSIGLDPQFFTQLTVLSPEGKVICSFGLPVRNPDFTALPAFQEAVRMRNFKIGEARFSSVSRRLYLPLFLPIMGEDQKIQAILMTDLDLGYMSTNVADSLGRDVGAFLFDCQTQQFAYGGWNVPAADGSGLDVRVKEVCETGNAHVFQRIVEGTARIGGLAPVDLRDENPVTSYSRKRLVAVIERSEGPLKQDINNEFRVRLIAIVLITFLSLGSMTLAAEYLVLRSVRHLVSASRRLAEGDLSARAESYSHDEFGQLAASFNDMVDVLQHSAGELKDANGMLAAVIEESPMGIIIMDQQFRVQSLNRSAAAIFGYDAAAVQGQRLPILSSNLESELDWAIYGLSLGGTLSGYQANCARADGERVDVNLSGTSVMISQESPRSVILMVEDVTGRKQIETQLHHAQKMESIGRLTGGFAHDFNNLLAVIMGNLDLTRERVKDDAIISDLVNNALDAAQRGAELNRQLLSFARKRPMAPRVIAPAEMVEGMTKILKRAIGETIEVRMQVCDPHWKTFVDPAQFESALLNLCVNARDAMPGGGVLLIETKNVTLDEDYARIHSEVTPGEFVEISVSDNGTGIPEEVLPRVFEPFFTTKQASHGTGLGLSMVYGFVKQSGGHITIDSELGLGTTIHVYLPRSHAQSDAAVVAMDEAIVQGNGELILVVEDNPLLRPVVVKQLQDLGYRTVEADGAFAALAELGSGRPVDLLFTDIVMPGGIDGRDLAKQARMMRPDLKVLFTSGFTGDAPVLENLGATLLSKPYRKIELARAIREALDMKNTDATQSEKKQNEEPEA